MGFRNAIVIPFNPHLDFWGGSAIGSLAAHKMFADKYGSVFWDLARSSPHHDVIVAYFYDVQERAVTFKSKVEFMELKNNINPNEEKYIPNWRKVNWEDKQTPGQVWLKLRDIFPLKRKHNLSDFEKISDGKKLKRVQNFAIVKDPRFKEEKIRFSLDHFLDDYVYRLTYHRDEKLQETDIEEMLWFLMLEKNLKYVERQRGKDNRIDIAFKDHKDQFIIVEIKKGTAGIETLAQIKKYMKEIGIKRGAKKLLGIILCRKADAKLQKAVKKEKNIFIDEYKFLIDFPRIRALLEPL
jgi:hypothetical protein